MTDTTTAKTVAICDTEPIAIEGIRALLDSCQGLSFAGAENSAASGLDMVSHLKPAVAIIDKAFGVHMVVDWISKSNALSEATAVVVWGAAIHGSEAVRFMQSGARGVMRKNTDLQAMLDCLRAVSTGRTWLEQCLLRDSERLPSRVRNNLTQREQEVLELVELGMKNKDIALQLEIQPGTVKIHLKHIFEKTGIHGRYGLALNGLKEKGLIERVAAG
jgi:DNA-binding NarL/FixJ family response regulator